MTYRRFLFLALKGLPIIRGAAYFGPRPYRREVVVLWWVWQPVEKASVI